MSRQRAVSQTETDAREIGATEILDACCGGRMWWWDKAHPLAVYMDKREEARGVVPELTGRPEWNPNWECKPDVLGDFTAMPFEDASFQLVVFDPPHIVREVQPPAGINGLKYGALHPDTEQDDLRHGFAECWRVLVPGGTLVFKWAGPLARVEPYFPASPTVGSRNAPRGSNGLGTRWFIFYKPLTTAHVARSLSDCAGNESLSEPTASQSARVRARRERNGWPLRRHLGRPVLDVRLLRGVVPVHRLRLGERQGDGRP